MRLTSTMKYSLYNILKRTPNVKEGSYLSLYKSNVFSGQNLSDNLSKSEASQRYKQFLPFMILGTTGAYKNRVLVSGLDFNPESETIKVTSVRHRGVITQQFRLHNIIPITYADMRAYNKITEPDFPPFIDDTMTYLNKFNEDFYLFQHDGTWNEQTVNHPKLSLKATFNEKQWFDRRNAI